jgi:uncharacterized protein (TIGR00255 family)
MALHSMTGYGRGEASLRGGQAVVELRSVNRRQLDIQVTLPRALAPLEPRVLDEIRAAISRGRIHGEVWMQHPPEVREEAAVVDETAAAVYVKALRQAAKRLGLADDLGVSHLLSLPEVVRFQAPEADPEAAWPLVRRALRRALRNLVTMRRTEGRAMQDDLLARLDAIDGHLAEIAAGAPRVAAQYRRALHTRLEQAGLPLDPADERLLREVAMFADRVDISEEVTRLRSHSDQARALIRSRTEAGKPLDFLAQEMFREVNTIGAKANDADIAGRVVQCKTELDRMREQVQNIE